MSELPPVAPDVLAEALDGMAARLRRRADALVADRGSWTVHPVDDGLAVDLGEVVTLLVAPSDTITDPQQVRCGCLLAPRCAHRAAVLTAAPVGQDRAVEDSPAAPAPSTAEPSERHLDDEQRRLLDVVGVHLSLLLTGGVHRADAEILGALGADLQLLRVHRLVVAGRALTAVLHGVDVVRGEDDTRQARTDLVRALGTLALNVHSLRRADADGGVDEDLLGQERQRYHPVGGLTLDPACVEPVLTGSGFAGVVVTFLDSRERVWTLHRVAPSDLAGIGQRYAAGVDWGGLSCDVATLSRSKVVVAGATASATGRLGGGRGVRASLAGSHTPSWERLCTADGRWQVLEGEIAGGGPTGLVLDTPTGRADLGHAAAAGRDSGGLALLARARGARVQVLVRSEGTGQVLLGVRPLDDLVATPEELGGHLWPGLDLVRRDWFGELHRDERHDELPASEIAAWQAPPSSVREVLARWLTRSALDGAGAVRGGGASLERDARALRAAGAPFAADLLDRLVEASHAGEVTGGRWSLDGGAFVRAWLALDRY